MGDINDCVDQSDFEDEDEEVQQEPGKRGRGPDKEWFEEGVYQNKAAFDESEFKKNLHKEMTKRAFMTQCKQNFEFYCCKQSKRKSFKQCPVFKKVAYLPKKLQNSCLPQQ